MPLGLDSNFYVWVLPLVLAEIVLYAYAFTAELRTCQVVLGLLGLFWCFAALWVEIRLEVVYPHFDYATPPPGDPEMKSYRPFCDFAPWAKCSKVLMSPPGRFLRYFGIAKPLASGAVGGLDKARALIDVPNPTLGVLFFAVHLFYPVLLLFMPIPFLGPLLPELFFLACCGVGLMTVWLAYNLAFVLQDFCVVCVSMYVANFGLIPMMHGLALQGASVGEGAFFGEVPRWFLYSFGALDAVMGLAVLAIYFRGDLFASAKARESEQGYCPLLVE
ncbi:Vkorc1l1 [Symbiodinium natans]|uniref:vitamin-K-epoxide reductase (warfarin-sensitive) n=1 Tax=Symbiodinium natans TaxID=878477 RepID=A0A812UXV1_9DINO|nr:Vkorc1l1 [Symbiodinium natans]